ncbi:hypothetical protein Cni_G29482 [Canna indica]|uniref:Uncharacterized protein n=1 Tax=Canna indica TaxID=4628 RepID=A0AAQ3L7D1_9LILI|nr:hypothetical protein Cni_G29482 [Canna indica]
MSNLVDMWTAEMAKLREKSRAALASPRSTEMERARELNEFSMASEPEELSLGYPALSQAIRMKPPSLRMTDAAVSLLVDCFSP